MEHMDHLSDTNLSELEEIIKVVCPMLHAKINKFKELPGKLHKIQQVYSEVRMQWQSRSRN